MNCCVVQPSQLLLSGIVPQFTRMALKRALYFSRFMFTLSTFFHSLLAWILLRSQQSVRSLSCRHLSRKSGKTEVSKMPSKETDLWKNGIDKQDELLRYDENKMLTLSSKISRYRTTPSLRTQMYFRSSLPSTRKKRRPEIRLRWQQEWFAGYTTPVTA